MSIKLINTPIWHLGGGLHLWVDVRTAQPSRMSFWFLRGKGCSGVCCGDNSNNTEKMFTFLIMKEAQVLIQSLVTSCLHDSNSFLARCLNKPLQEVHKLAASLALNLTKYFYTTLHSQAPCCSSHPVQDWNFSLTPSNHKTMKPHTAAQPVHSCALGWLTDLSIRGRCGRLSGISRWQKHFFQYIYQIKHKVTSYYPLANNKSPSSACTDQKGTYSFCYNGFYQNVLQPASKYFESTYL